MKITFVYSENENEKEECKNGIGNRQTNAHEMCIQAIECECEWKRDKEEAEKKTKWKEND